MTPKRILPDKELRDIEKNNQIWFQEYVKNSGKPSRYFDKIEEFLKFCAFNNDKPIRQLNKDDVNTYVEALITNKAQGSTIRFRLIAIASFRNYLIDKHNFDEKFLANLPKHTTTTRNPTGIPLNLKQLNYARKFNRSSKSHIQDEYIFEMFFQLGVGENDLVNNSYPKNIESIQIRELVKKAQEVGIKIEDGTLTSYYTRLTKHLKKQGLYDKKRDINSRDLHESHKSYFRKCPNCGKGPFENTANNWVLAKIKLDGTEYQGEYYIVCAQCKGAPNA